MPGLTNRSAPGGSRKENTNTQRVNVKAEKMAAKSKGQGRRASSKPTGENEDEEDDASDREREGSPKGSKRSRINVAGDSRSRRSSHAEGEDEDDEASADDDDDQGETSGGARRVDSQTLPRDDDGFIPGSIKRIRLENFVTYDYVEFFPGSHLNMIIGPNGTGKSSIACAIALGLNGAPALLGRAEQINSFVKQGKDTGYIEIELKGPKGKPNLVIRRNLAAGKRTSTFTINGKSASGKDVTTKVNALNVQITNLCSFLPQDKVTEFAAMSPQELLKQTQLAAGNSNLTEWHRTLIEEGTALKKIQEELKAERDDLAQQRSRNDRIENQVELVRKIQEIEQEIKVLQVLLPAQSYREFLTSFNNAKAVQRQRHELLKALRSQNEPVVQFKKKLENDCVRLESQRTNLKSSTQTVVANMRKKWELNEEHERTIEDANSKLESLEKEQRERAEKIRDGEASVRRYRAEAALVNDTEDEVALQAEVDQLKREAADVHAKHSDLKEKIRRNLEEEATQVNKLNNAQHQLRALDNKDNQKLTNLKQWSPPTFEALMWLRQNQQRFKMGIVEPAAVSMSVIDPKYANAVEACINAIQQLTFVAQCHEDYNLFNQLVQDGGALNGHKLKVAVWYRDAKAALPPPMSRETLKSLRLDGYVLDYIQHPPGMEAFLKVELQMHRTSVALDGSKVHIDQIMTEVARVTEQNPQGAANVITGMTIHQVSRSRYGQKKVQNITRDIRPARNLKDIGVDAGQKARIDGEIREFKMTLQMTQEEHQQLRKEISDIEDENSQFSKRRDALSKRKAAIQNEMARRAKAKSTLARAEETLRTLRKATDPTAERARLKAKILEVAKKRVFVAREYSTLCRKLLLNQKDYATVSLQVLQVTANKTALDAMVAANATRLNKAEKEFNESHAEYTELKGKTKAALKELQDLVNDLESPISELYLDIQTKRVDYEEAVKVAQRNNEPEPSAEGIEQRTVEELNTAITDLEVRLETHTKVDAGIIDEYEKRKEAIERLEGVVEAHERSERRVAKKIADAKSNWKPALEKLVGSIGAKFSAAFDRIGCAGEIHIREEEDYEKWAIDILVKFRDDEKLQLLTSQRQSGGERSLTTILYLMSLTEEARAPFSLVDEINQGMDQRAERVVHNSMVDVTCKDDAGQYFLITPKLLPDLKYHKLMKVLCVYNGEWLPEEKGLGNLMNMVENHVRYQGAH